MSLSGISNELNEAVASAIDHADACAAVRDIYARLQTEIDRRKPICVASGKCCHFESYGHRLYVTTLELAAFVKDLQEIPKPRAEVFRRPGSDASDSAESGSSEYLRPRLGVGLNVLDHSAGDGCVFQVEKLCSVHAIRPFGCRIFFCDPSATDWQQEQYELFHRELKDLHRRFNVPYFYVEWRQALSALNISQTQR